MGIDSSLGASLYHGRAGEVAVKSRMAGSWWLALALCWACRTGAPGWVDESPHASSFTEADGVRLETLDWGGSGPALVMIHGIGDDPHVFDDLAARLRDKFHVVAYARRGHGHSSAPPDGPYDLATLVEDLRQLMDRLNIERANLLGWSMGGNEITAFAGRYPERVDKLVYLESAYDWSDPAFLAAFDQALVATAPDTAALASLDAYRAWWRATWLGDAVPWSNGLEAYLRDTVVVGADGRLEPRPNEKVAELLFESLAAPPRDYSAVQAPALVVYAGRFFPASNPKTLGFDEKVMTPFRQASRERIQRELAHERIFDRLGCTHMSSGFEQLDTLAALIPAFLAPPPP
jgi:pimeloyl-ACP methyl ester carboxylesterase